MNGSSINQDLMQNVHSFYLDQRFKLNGYKIQTKNGLEQNKKWVRALSVLMYAGLLTGPVCPLN